MFREPQLPEGERAKKKKKDTSVHVPALLGWSSALFLVEGEQLQPEFLKAKRKHDLTKCHT